MFSRRLFLAGSSAALWLPAMARAQSNNYHFSLGVTSGSPQDTSVVLWTRLAPEPLTGGGMPAGPTQVRYRVCSDDAMTNTVRQGLAWTSDAKAHAVHVIVDGLEPGREYWYQFMYGEDESPVGRTRTTSRDAAGASFALANCQSYETGQYAAYADIAEWAPDCVIHVGDYIYEGGAGVIGPVEREWNGRTLSYEVVRQHNGPEVVSLYEYRNRHALYRSDPQLQAAHAAAPWIVAMDDHEIDNNWAGDTPQDPEKQSQLEFQVRKMAALQAYYEHMPLRNATSMNGLQMFGGYRFGPAEVSLIDTRQFRSDQVCGQGFPGDFPCDDLNNPALTMTGEVQEQWLLDRLKRSDAPFNVIANQTWFAPFEYNDTPGWRKWNMDQWDGYPLQRQRLIDAMADGVSNPIILSGDWHSAMAMGVHKDPLDHTSPLVAHNFAATSISSICPWSPIMEEARDANRHLMHLNGEQRGYLRCVADGSRWTAQYRTVDNPTDANSSLQTDTEIVVG